jgi:hypothetical protein
MEPELINSDYIYKIKADKLINIRGEVKATSPVDGHDLAWMPVKGWYRAMVSTRNNRADREEDDRRGGAYYIVAMPNDNGDFDRPPGDPEFEFEALVSF